MLRDHPRFAALLTAWVSALGVSACAPPEDDGPAASPAIVHAIEARKANYKEIGGAFKTISDELKHDQPDRDGVAASAREILTRGREQLQYFPQGSGPESREKTRAKAAIWSELQAFTQAHEQFVADSSQLVDAVTAGADRATLAARQKALGERCKACHDRFRVPD